jgi:hypothetical protein
MGVRPNKIRILDSWHTERPSRFLTDNFGTYQASHGGIYPPDAIEAAACLTVVSPEHQIDARLAPRELEMVPTEMLAFREFANRRATSLSILSARLAPRLEVRTPTAWSNTFNLVVGDTFEDSVLFWNARLLIPAWLDGDLCCLRVTIEQLDDPEFAGILKETLNQRETRTNHISGASMDM